MHGEEVAGRDIPIHAKPDLAHAPRVVGIPAAGAHRIASVQIFRIDAVVDVWRELSAVACRRRVAQFGATAADEEAALGGLRAFRGHINHTVHSIGAPLGRAGTADDLDAVEVFHHSVLHIPIHSGVERRVDGAPVEQHEHLVGKHIVETTRSDGPLAGVDLGNFEVPASRSASGRLVAPARRMSSAVMT